MADFKAGVYLNFGISASDEPKTPYSRTINPQSDQRKSKVDDELNAVPKICACRPPDGLGCDRSHRNALLGAICNKYVPRVHIVLNHVRSIIGSPHQVKCSQTAAPGLPSSHQCFQPVQPCFVLHSLLLYPTLAPFV